MAYHNLRAKYEQKRNEFYASIAMFALVLEFKNFWPDMDDKGNIEGENVSHVANNENKNAMNEEKKEDPIKEEEQEEPIEEEIGNEVLLRMLKKMRNNNQNVNGQGGNGPVTKVPLEFVTTLIAVAQAV